MIMRLEFSAGGVVFKKSDGDLQILVAHHSGHHGWVFQKGLIGDHKKGETKEETAVREVEEETGIKARILKPLTPITYWYVWEGEKRKKTVYYFLMEFVEDTGKRDDEMEAVEWILPSQVEQKLTYPTHNNLRKQAQHPIK